MATAREQALQSLRDMGYSQGQIDSAMAKVSSAQKLGTSNSSIMNDVKSNTSTYFGGGAMYGSGSSSSSSSSSSNGGGSGLTNKDTSSNTNAGDIYGDVGGKREGATPMDFSNASGTIDEASLSFGANAAAKQAKNSNYLSNRNNDIASYLYALNKDKGGEVAREDVSKYLNNFDDFKNSQEWEKNNTIDAILARYGEVKKEKEKTDTGVTGVDETSLNDTKAGGATTASDGFYLDKDGNETKIYGYDELDDFYKGLIDREDNETRKYLSNLGAQGMQEKVKYFLDSKREEKQIKDAQDIKKELHDIDMQEFAIQQAQTIRNAEESYNNLKQNWQYLGNMGMPGTSATKIQAIGDCITEAKTQLNELNKLLDLQKSGKETEWKGQVLNYTQQMENIAYDLKWKVGDELTGLLSKFTTAELEGKLDTIDGITAFRKDLLDELDKNLSGITSASLSQMQYLNQEYQKLADKAEEYAKNANKVNADMSAVKGYYVDDNGNPILDNYGQVIKTQGTDWMEPVFDKETGKLITFTYDENGNRVANVEQLWDNYSSNPPMYSGMSGLGGSGNSGYLNIPRNVNGFKNNVGADTNNFGNIRSAVAGSIGMYKSPKGLDYAVFATAQDGYNALVNDIKAKQSGNSRTGLNGNSTIEELMGVWVNGSGSVDPSHRYAKDFYSVTGLKPGTKIGTVDANLLAKGIMAGEGTLAAYQKGGVDLTAYANQGVQGGGQNYNSVLVDLFKKDSLTAEDKKTITASTSEGGFGMTMPQFGDAKEAWLAQQNGTSKELDRLNKMRDAIGFMIANYPGEFASIIAESGAAQASEKILNVLKKRFGLSQKEASSMLGDFAAKYKFLRDNLTTDYFLDLKKGGATFGAMSNAEWDIVSRAASDLNLKSQSEGEFINSLVDIYNQLGDDLVGNLSAKEIVEQYKYRHPTQSVNSNWQEDIQIDAQGEVTPLKVEKKGRGA